jgi:hypothetical protein
MGKRTSRSIRIVGIVCSALLSIQQVNAQEYDVARIDSLPGYGMLGFNDSLNDKCTVTVGSFEWVPGDPFDLIQWELTHGVAREIGRISIDSESQERTVTGINYVRALNNRGTIIGEQEATNSPQLPLQSRRGGEAEPFPAPRPGWQFFPNTMNDLDMVTGTAVSADFTQFEYLTYVGGRYVGHARSGFEQVAAINNRLSLFGYLPSVGDQPGRMAIKRVGDRIRPLVTDPGSYISFFEGMNNQETVLGTSYDLDGNSLVNPRAVVWPYSRRPVAVAAGLGFERSRAADLNNEGLVVGTGFDATDSYGFLWKQGRGGKRLNDLLKPEIRDTVKVEEVYAVNDRGEILARVRNTVEQSTGPAILYRVGAAYPCALR